MIVRFLLMLAFSIFVARLFWRVVDSFVEGIQGGRASRHVPEKRARMVRDPVCGTFLLPENAVILVDGRARVFFCSEACRDKYRARTA